MYYARVRCRTTIIIVMKIYYIMYKGIIIYRYVYVYETREH